MQLRINHRTTFTYAGNAHDSFNEVRIRPIDDAFQKCLSFDLRLDPVAAAQEYSDFYGNTIHYFDIADAHTKLVVEATFDNSPANPSNPSSPPKRVTWGEETTDEMLFCFFLLTSEKTGDLIHTIFDNLGHDMKQPRKDVSDTHEPKK